MKLTYWTVGDDTRKAYLSAASAHSAAGNDSVVRRGLELPEPVITRPSVVRVLNELLAMDRGAISVLFQAEVRVNADVADHPTVEVGTDKDGHDRLRLLGLLNGLFPDDPDDHGRRQVIAKVVDMVCSGCGVVLEDVPLGDAHVGEGPGYRVHCGTCIEGPIRGFTTVLV